MAATQDTVCMERALPAAVAADATGDTGIEGKASSSWLPRIQWFEWEDCAWLPVFLRDAITDALGLIMKTFNAYKPAFPLLAEWAGDSDDLLDMASGSGTHVRELLQWAEQEGVPIPRVRVSDLYPSRERLTALETAFPNRVRAELRSVDATRVPDELKGLPRSMFTAFHHLAPDQARAALADAARHADGILICEPHPRTIRNLLANIPGLFFGMLTPFLTGKFTWKRLLFCTLIPIVPLMLVHDGIVSVLRCYTAAEFRAMIRALPDNNMEWRIVEVPGHGAMRFMKGLCVMGRKTG